MDGHGNSMTESAQWGRFSDKALNFKINSKLMIIFTVTLGICLFNTTVTLTMYLADTAVSVCGMVDFWPDHVGEASCPVTQGEECEDEGKNPGQSAFGQQQQSPGGQVFH